MALQEMDIPNWQELVMPPEMIAQQMQQSQQKPQTQDIRIKPKDMTDAEVAQLLQSRGIRPDVQGRALKSSAIIQEKNVEQETGKVKNLESIVSMMNELENQDNEPKVKK
jgi:hypothetical protein